MNAGTQHVVPHGDQWAVKGEGSRRLTVFPTKREAIDAARQIAAEKGTNLLVHGKMGQTFYRSDVLSSVDEETIRQAVRKTLDVIAEKKATADQHEEIPVAVSNGKGRPIPSPSPAAGRPEAVRK